MRYIAPALLSLAALVAAQSTDCVTRYESCLTTKAEPECNSELTQCKDSCAKGLDTCNQSGSDSKTCQSSYNSCLNTFPIIPGGSDCVAKFIKCSNSGQSADSCNAQNAVCKDSCTNINSACLSSGSADQAGCSKQYNQCYYSTEDTIEIDCISKYQTCLASGKSVSDCNVVLKSCKDSCTTIQATCLVSGTADSSFCSDLTNKCYYNGSKWTQTDCASSFASCKSSGKADADCRAALTSCKDTCTNAESACRSGQNADVAACTALRQTCDGSSSDPSGNTDASTTFSAKVAISTGGYTYTNGTSGNNATSTHTPATYTGAADKAGVASVAGLLALAAYIL